MTRGNNRCVVLLVAILVVWFGHGERKAWGWAASSEKPVPVPYYAPPRHMDLCGTPVPLQNEQVWERFDREFTIAVYNRGQVYLWLKRMERYFPWLQRQLKIHHLPQDLKYVTVAESDLLHDACSPAGAMGPWQFIPSTGRIYGLIQTRDIDERQNFRMATRSAFHYLRDLHDQFHSWALALAAYNCGAQRVQEAIKRQQVDNYYQLELPLETERYVFRILAIKAILSHPGRYGYQLPQGAGYPPLQDDPVTVKVPYSLPIEAVAQAAGMTYRGFKVLNPEFISDTVPPGTYTLNVAQGRTDSFQTKLAAVEPQYAPRQPQFRVIYHRVRSGQTLGGIAGAYRVSIRDLRVWNHLHGNVIRIGQVLVVKEREQPQEEYQGGVSRSVVKHRVRRGETVGVIARHYGVSVRDLREWNHLHGNMIRIGQVLVVKGGELTRQSGSSAPVRQGGVSKSVVKHRVRRGETLGIIARRYGVSVRDLRAWNHLHGNVIRIGQVLRVQK